MFLELLFKLGMAHAVTDLALQGPQFSGKTPDNPYWPLVLTGHALVNAAGVTVVTGSTWLGLMEFIWHWTTDFCSCRYYYRTGHKILWLDQASHALSKAIWTWEMN